MFHNAAARRRGARTIASLTPAGAVSMGASLALLLNLLLISVGISLPTGATRVM